MWWVYEFKSVTLFYAAGHPYGAENNEKECTPSTLSTTYGSFKHTLILAGKDWFLGLNLFFITYCSLNWQQNYIFFYCYKWNVMSLKTI